MGQSKELHECPLTRLMRRPGPAATAGAAAYPRRWLAAVVMIGAALMDMIDITVVNVALPTIRTDLGASGTQLEWVVSAYMLAFAAVLIIAGSFGDLFGRKRVFLAGIAGFGGRQPGGRAGTEPRRADRRAGWCRARPPPR
jgi:hypothetical protein